MNAAAWVVLGAALAIVYVLVMYPLVLSALARRGKPIRKGAFETTVTVVIPVRNGAAWLADKLDSVLKQEYPARLVDVLILSDGSTDETDAVAARYVGERVRFERLERGGKGAALTYAFPRVQGEILLLTDVRQKLAPDCLKKLVACFADPQVGAASGDLVILKGRTAGEANTGLYWRYETWIRRNLSAVDSLLGATGPIYALRRSLAVPVPRNTLLDDVYLPMEALRRGYRLVLEPEAKAFDFPTSLDSEFRRKVRTQAGIYQLFWLSPWIVSPANRMWFHWISLKLGRLFLPWFLLAIAAATPFLDGPWRWVAIAAQVLFYAAAWIDGYLAEGSALKKLTSPVRAFVVLVLAALVAVRIFFVNPRSLWKETTVGTVGG